MESGSTIGAEWYCWLRNDGSGIITVDPASTNQIDGATTITLFPGETIMIVRVGSSNFKTVGRAPSGAWILAETLSPSGVASVDSTFGFASGYDHKWEITNLDMASDAVGLDMRISLDGSTFRSTAGDYQWSLFNVESAAAANYSGSFSDTEISLAPASGTDNDLGDAAGEAPHCFVIEGLNLDTSNARKLFRFNTSTISSLGRFNTGLGSGSFKGTTGAILGVRFLSSANFSGTIKHYVKRR
jgi:hypothetical protein